MLLGFGTIETIEQHTNVLLGIGTIERGQLGREVLFGVVVVDRGDRGIICAKRADICVSKLFWTLGDAIWTSSWTVITENPVYPTDRECISTFFSQSISLLNKSEPGTVIVVREG